jgi:hypothetical protein
MHMHVHLAEMIRDYGPIYSFWCFSYERYNGMLNSLPTNRRDVGEVMMRTMTKHRRLLSDALCDVHCSTEERELLQQITDKDFVATEYDLVVGRNDGQSRAQSTGRVELNSDSVCMGDAVDNVRVTASIMCAFYEYSLLPLVTDTLRLFRDGVGIRFPGKILFDGAAVATAVPIVSTERARLDTTFRAIYSGNAVRRSSSIQTTFRISDVWVKSKRMRLCGQVFTSLSYRHKASSYVLVHAPIGVTERPCRLFPAQLMYFVKVTTYVFDARRQKSLTDDIRCCREELARVGNMMVQARSGESNASATASVQLTELSRLEEALRERTGRPVSHLLARVRWFRSDPITDPNAEVDHAMRLWRAVAVDMPGEPAEDDRHPLRIPEYSYVPVQIIAGRMVRLFSYDRQGNGSRSSRQDAVFQVCQLKRQFQC